MKDEATHQPILFEAILQTTGPILEMGAGRSSTEQIHKLAKGRKILTVDDNQEWLDNFKHLESDTHQFALFTDKLFEEYGRDWSVVLIDLSTWDQRMWTIEKLRYFAEYLVIHDAQGKGLERLFVYHREYRVNDFPQPTTMLASNIRVLTSFHIEGASYG